MNQAHWHLVLNHFPIIGTISSLTLMIIGIFLNKSDIKNVALGSFVVTGLLTIPAYLTGEGAEHIVEAAGINADAFVEIHEDLGVIALWACVITAVFAAITFFLEAKKISASKILLYITLATSLANLVVLKKVGTSGGEIMHTEIRGTNTIDNPIQSVNKQQENKKNAIEEDDD
jgi:hypothetical protein